MVIYLTVNLINGKGYIGLDSKNNPSYLGSGKLIKRAIKKYGKQNFQKHILEYCNTNDDLNKREVHWIEFFNAVTDDNFYNLLSGGQGCLKGEENPMYGNNLYKLWVEKYGTETADDKMIEYKHKLSKAFSGENNPMFGKRNPRAKYIGKFDNKHNLLDVFYSVREASELCHHHRNHLAKWHKSGEPNRLGHIWGFINEEIYFNFKNKLNEN